jgi:hypothetical protein
MIKYGFTKEGLNPESSQLQICIILAGNGKFVCIFFCLPRIFLSFSIDGRMKGDFMCVYGKGDVPKWI